MDCPQPDQIKWFPAGTIHYLFRKVLTKTDVERGLILVKGAIHFLCSRGESVRESLIQGHKTTVYTPRCSSPVNLKRELNGCSFSFNRRGWDVIVNLNKFYVGLSIDCWAVTDDQNQFHFLIQPIEETKDQEAKDEGEGEGEPAEIVIKIEIEEQ